MDIYSGLVTLGSVIVGGFIAIIGSYINNKFQFNREVYHKKNSHLQVLLHEYIEIVNAEFNLIEQTFSITVDLYGIEFSNIEDFLKSEKLNDLLGKSKDKMDNIHVIESKYDFTSKLKLNVEMNEFRNLLFQFINFLDEIELANKPIPIGDEEKLYVENMIMRVSILKSDFKSTSRRFYSEKFLPHE